MKSTEYDVLSYKECISRQYNREEDMRGPYFRDQTAIIHSAPFRRLKHKTQVFFAPDNDHVCTRIEHVLHVATIAATICKGLQNSGWELEPELAYAAGLGHDLGHAPFGHSGERALAQANKIGFEHELHSLRVVDKLARSGKGLNLTLGVRDAILCHNGERFEQFLIPDCKTPIGEKTYSARKPATWEGCVVRYADKIAYLGRDIEDALLAGFIKKEDVPKGVQVELGQNNGDIINSLVIDVIATSLKEGKIGVSSGKHGLIKELVNFNYSRIYNHPKLVEYQYYCNSAIKRIFERLYNLCTDKIAGNELNISLPIDDSFIGYMDKMQLVYEGEDPYLIVTDYVSGMTDNYALKVIEDITMPKPIVFG